MLELMSTTTIATTVIPALICLLLLTYLFRDKSIPPGSKFPPGPPPKPFLGNILDLPPYWYWLKFKSWSDTYGPIFAFHIFGVAHYVVSTERVANALLRDRSAIYSSREHPPAASVLLTDRRGLLFMPVDPADPQTETLKKIRKLYHQQMSPTALIFHAGTHNIESLRLVHSMLRAPNDYESSFNTYAAAVIYRLVFGKRIASAEDPDVAESLRILRVVEAVARPGTYLVDSFPSLMYLPEWLAPFKRYLRSENRKIVAHFLAGVDGVREAINAGTATPSFTRLLLEQQDTIGLDELEGAYSSGVLFAAGFGTTAAALATILLALVLHPAWQARMQTEIDRVVGETRVPDFDDMPALPSVRAVVKEALRWRPVTAGGIPHKCIKDDVFEGIFIPKGTHVHPNQWAIHREEALYPDPESFRPERWLEREWRSTYRDPLEVYPNMAGFSAFGFGRRICPGLGLAERSLYIAVARIGWACSVGKKRDEMGEEVDVPLYDYTTEGFNSQPKRFDFALQARSQERVRVLEEAWEKAKREDPLRGE